MAGARNTSSQGEMLHVVLAGQIVCPPSSQPTLHRNGDLNCTARPQHPKAREVTSGQKSCQEQLVSAVPWGRPQNTAMVSVQASCTHALAGGNVICAAAHGPLRTQAQHGPEQPQCGSRPVTGVELLPSYLTQSRPGVWSLSSAGR